jgi:hypothetical protein
VSAPLSSSQLCSEKKSLIMQNQTRVDGTNSQAAEELGTAMGSPNCSPHRIGILMSQTGRFLECISCRLSFAFPPGTQYEKIAKQFEAHLCGSAAIAGRED